MGSTSALVAPRASTCLWARRYILWPIIDYPSGLALVGQVEGVRSQDHSVTP